ncbi:hypothetical protein J4216_06670 [Candidatus Woesearchaeota archaeon]|nr:hypothetical protein [Candidatus Woesearchaeota archaeon]
MFNKKGDLGLPIYFLPTVAFFAIILFIFSIFFFVIGVTKNPNLVINPESFSDESKITTLVKTQTSQNISIAEIIISSAKDQTKKELLEKELKILLSKLPKPEARDANWNLDIKIENQDFLNTGIKTVGAKDYYKQSIIIPLESKKLAKLDLYLNCYGCSIEDIRRNA